MDSVQTALELYYNDAGAYPDVDSWEARSCADNSDNGSQWTDFVSDLSPHMQGSVPTPPGKSYGGSTNCYWYRIDGHNNGDSGCHIDDGTQSYVMLFYSENTDFNLPIYEKNRNGNEGDLYCVTSS